MNGTESPGGPVEPEGPPEFIPARIETRLSELQELQHSIMVADKVAEIALAITRAHDWTYFGERPWLCRNGAERIRNRLGISIHFIPDALTNRQYTQYEITDDVGSYIVVEMAAKVSHPKFGEIEALGFSTSRDKFLGMVGTDQEGKPIWKPITEVNLTHIRMKAFTNLWVNAITRFCGVTPSKEELETRFGAGKIGKVAFRDKEDKRTPEDVADESKKARALWAILVTMSEGDESGARTALAALTAFKAADGKQVAGVTDVNKMKGTRLKIACENGKKLWEDFLKSNEGRADFFRGLLAERLKTAEKPAEAKS